MTDPVNIARYELREITLPEPLDEATITRVALGLEEMPARGTRRVLQITLETPDEFPMNETFRGVSIGMQRVGNLAVSPDGKRATGIVDRAPQQGDRIVLHLPAAEGGPTMLAGTFDESKLDWRFA
jgi:hypothetical protein